eukprot:TRINITY_DN39704_c0_g1_i1.p1 TRINITY_DN39704_c0_g1~~TRINITY_DN39704_c0_g1_i1.p1  ORF type:complete len:500 (+),score=76.34 TRINITY_DN39704_c0_g1_i1:45-1502(+)
MPPAILLVLTIFIARSFDGVSGSRVGVIPKEDHYNCCCKKSSEGCKANESLGDDGSTPPLYTPDWKGGVCCSLKSASCSSAALRKEGYKRAPNTGFCHSEQCGMMPAVAIAAPTGSKSKTVPQQITYPIPTPKSNEVLIRVKASSVNHLDLVWNVVDYGWWNMFETAWKAQKGGYPKLMGMDVAGIVVAKGSGVTKFEVGDEVWSFNSFAAMWDGKTFGGVAGHGWASYASVAEIAVAKKPKSLSWVEAGSMPLCALTSLGALKAVGAPWSKVTTVLILGSTGGTGHLAVQLAKALGATTVIATASARNFDLVRSWGADKIIDYGTEDWKNASVVPDGSLDAVYDTVMKEPDAGTIAFTKKLKRGGKFVSLCSGMPTCHDTSPTAVARLKNPDKSSTALRCLPGLCSSGALLDEVGKFVDAGKLKVHVGQVFPMTDTNAAIEVLESGRAKGKVALAGFNDQPCTLPAQELSENQEQQEQQEDLAS